MYTFATEYLQKNVYVYRHTNWFVSHIFTLILSYIISEYLQWNVYIYTPHLHIDIIIYYLGTFAVECYIISEYLPWTSSRTSSWATSSHRYYHISSQNICGGMFTYTHRYYFYVPPSSFQERDVTHTYEWHDPFICVTCPIHIYLHT